MNDKFGSLWGCQGDGACPKYDVPYGRMSGSTTMSHLSLIVEDLAKCINQIYTKSYKGSNQQNTHIFDVIKFKPSFD